MRSRSQSISNQSVAELLAGIGEYLEMQRVPFKPRAYQKAAQAIASLEENVGDVYKKGGIKALEEIPGVGQSIAEKIEEYVKTGHVKEYDALAEKTPVKLEELSRVEGLGPQKIKVLYEKLGVKNLKDLESVARKGKIAGLARFGKKTEDNILQGIDFLKSSGGRFVLGMVMPEVREIAERLRNIKDVGKLVIAGSIRRMKETIGDADMLVIAKKSRPVMEYFTRMPEVAKITAHGDTKSSVKLKSGLNIDLRVVPTESYGAALNYFTGSKDHNVALRQIAIKYGYKLNEYGLYSAKGGSASGGKGSKLKMIAGKTEEEIYKALGLEYIEPEMREMTGEIETARKHELPKLIGYGDLLGDLQVQTDWTDGSDSIETMAREAIKHGLKYIAITDHTKRLAMTHGLDEKRIVKQWAEIDRVNKKLAGKIKILKGTECDILEDGSLDLPDKILSQLDVVGISIHSHFNFPRKEQTERIIRAISSPHVDMLFHPTGRIIQRRKAYEIDMDAVIKSAKKAGTVLEINALPERLDLKDDHIRKCVDAEVKMSIDSDAHSPQHFAFLEYGIAQARRGWATDKDIINTWPLEKMLGSLKKK